MKKIVCLCLLITTLISVCVATTLSSLAYFGFGAAVVASDVKMIKTGLLGQKLSFSDGDFKSALCITDFDTVTITDIPSSTEGTLLLGGRRVGKGRVIKRKNLGTLVFVPASNTVNESKFKFTVDGYGGGAEIECIMKFIDKVNYAPKIEEQSTATIKTQESITVYGELCASDPEGDILEFIIVSYPKRGTLTLIDSETGRYSYTPTNNFVGEDKFTYVVRDEYGNYSKPSAEKLKVIERMCDTVYKDMEEREEYNAAVAMSAMGVMGGELIGDDLYFHPDEAVSRAQFVSMSMKCAGIRADTTLGSTYFDDDADIPTSLRGYVATAQRLGLVDGDFTDGKLLFSPNEEITKYEAAKILATLLGADGGDEERVFAGEENIPVWARAAVSAMYTFGIFSNDEATLSEPVTRADIASYLYKLGELL